MGPSYHNPNPWVRLLHRANGSEIKIDGKIHTALIDSDAMILIMSKEYCEKHGYEIQPLDWLVPIQGGGVDVPYLGSVEVKMQIPGISSSEQDVLMLVSHTATGYHQWVPFQAGSRVIHQVVKNIMDEELRSLSQSWKLAYVGTVLSKFSQVWELDREFDLNQVKGNVIITKKVTISASQTVVVIGLTKVTGHCKHVHILVELSPKCQNIFPG